MELAGASGFMQAFMQASYIERYRIRNGNKEEIA